MSDQVAAETSPIMPVVQCSTEVTTVANKRKARVQEKAETIGERLARIRKERGITQQEMAELLSTSQPIVSDYERGETPVARRAHCEDGCHPWRVR